MARSRTLSSIDCRPLFMTERTPGRQTLGPRVAQISEILGRPFMPWQREVADVALEVIPDPAAPRGWRLAYDDATLAVMRQQGKTEFLFPLMTHRCTGFGEPQHVRYTAQNAYTARGFWEDIHVARLLASPFAPLLRVRKRLNQEAILWSNGSKWSPVSPTGSTAGTGESLDMAVIDEAWARPDNTTELGMRPATITRPKRQIWRVSMVPGVTRAKGVDSKYLRAAMRRGRAAVRSGLNTGSFYCEFGAPADADSADPATWWGCMPALGHMISEATIKSDYDAMDLIDFEAEYLSWWPQENIPSWTTIKELTWRALRDDHSSAKGQIAVAADCTDDRTQGYIGICGKRFDGDLHVEIVEPGHEVPLGEPGVEWMFKRLMMLVERWQPLTVVVDPKGAANFLIPLLKRERVEVTTPNIQQVEGACGRFYDATGQEGGDFDPDVDDEPPLRVRHIGQPELDRAVAGARKLSSPTTGTFRWHRVASVANICPLYVATLAMHGYEINADADYDVLNSVG